MPEKLRHNSIQSRVSLRQLRYFTCVAENGQIQAAANRINISASAVTDAIKNLEQTLGVKLVERHHKGMNLTHQGHLFYQHAISMLNQLDESVNLFRHKADRTTEELKIATTVAVMGYFLPKPLLRFYHAFPNIKVTLVEKPRERVEESLVRDDMDLGVIITSNISSRQELETETLFQSRRSVWCSANHPFSRQDEISIHEICKQPYIQLDMDEAQRNTDEICDLYDIDFKRVIVTSSVEAVRALVASGQGVTILSDLLFRPWTLDGGRLQSRSITELIPSMNVGLVRKKKQSIKNSVQIFSDFFKQEFSIQ